jgi:lipoprotein-anchoring transpeptidase ErfK/SrfK
MIKLSLPAALAAFCALSAATLQPAYGQIASARRADLGGGFIEFLYNGGQPGGPIPTARRADDIRMRDPGPGVVRAYPAAPRAMGVERPFGGRSVAVAPGLEPVRPIHAPQQHAAYAPEVEQALRHRSSVRPAIDPRYLPQTVEYRTSHRPGTVVIDTRERYLYLVEAGGMARRFGVGIGRPGFGWTGTKTITRKAEWPDWRPPADMLRRRPDLPRFMAGGPANPLGARAMYLGSSLYRIHGSNEPWTIGQAVSSGCFRMRNEDVMELYSRVRVGTRVVVM